MRAAATAISLSVILTACGGGGGDLDSKLTLPSPPASSSGPSTAPVTIPLLPPKQVGRYSLTLIPRGDGSTRPLDDLVAINNKAQVAGSIEEGYDWTLKLDLSHAILYTRGATLDLGTLGGPASEALGLNDAGQVVGASLTGGGAWRGFLYSNGSMVDVGTLGGANSAAYAVNISGDVVGESETSDGHSVAFLYQNGVMRALGSLGGDESVAFAINGARQIAGAALTSAGKSHAMVYRDGKMEDLGTLSGDASGATDINDKGQVVGWSQVRYESGVQYVAGFLHSNGTMTTIRSSTYQEVWPLALNNKGVVVGDVDEDEDHDLYAFVWDAVNGMRDLNDLIDPALGCRIKWAYDINDYGQIAAGGDCSDGNYEFDDATVGFVLTPAR